VCDFDVFFVAATAGDAATVAARITAIPARNCARFELVRMDWILRRGASDTYRYASGL
jgi:hypothetical protein